MISRARFGPVNTPAGWPGRTSLISSVIRLFVSSSRPLLRLMTGTQGRICGLIISSTLRNDCDGMPMMMTSFDDTASSMSVVAERSRQSFASGRYLLLQCSELISSTVASCRAHKVVGSCRATSEATAVPQDPPPSTAGFRFMAFYFLLLTIALQMTSSALSIVHDQYVNDIVAAGFGIDAQTRA